MPPATSRGRSVERDPADAPPDFKHYAIMGGLLAGPPILVVILFIAISGGKPETSTTGPALTQTEDLDKSRALTQRQNQERQIDAKVGRLVTKARGLQQRSGSYVKRFYTQEDPKRKMTAWNEAVKILREAQENLDKADKSDRYRRNETEVGDLRQLVDRDLQNIMKDKPIYLGD
ncbi:MAG: hypothetical protein O7H41_13425 [Planctomycetota bacterium]|nr:hypothetical protein [Planctomycetota bacterium]